MRKFFYQFIFSLKYISYIKNSQRRCYTRAITGDHITELNEKTLTGRLLNYLERNKIIPNKIDRITDTLDILKRNDTNNLGKCNTEEIISAFNLISNREYCKNKTEFLLILDLLDFELRRRLDQLNTTETLNVLHTYMKIVPHRIVDYKFYENSMKKLFSECNTLSKNDLIQYIFYLGLQKKTARSQFMLRKCMNLLNEELINNLNTEELCVICNSTFKTSTKINNTLILNKIVNYINNNLCIMKDPAIFITLIKAIRHNRYQDEELLATITCTMFFNRTINCYSFPALCHILAAYSDFLYYDENVMKIFTEKCVELLGNGNYVSKRIYLQEQPRAKDIKRFLWCLSNLNYKKLDKKVIREVIIPNVKNRIKMGELKDDFGSVIEMALYLWMLNYYDPEIISYVLTKQNVQYIRASAVPAKQRLDLLITCIYFEDRKLYKEINIPLHTNVYQNIDQQLEKRPLLLKVFENLKSIPSKFEVNKYTLECQVPNLNIIGITGYRKKIYKAVHIEILDDYTCMKNTDSLPSGLMSLKLRIMEQFDEGIIAIRANEVELMSNEELSNFLEDELDLVC
ncbi:uncharacterized protein LOC108910774 [Anoplophora glabripennis]|uniref:uncharacterized protein LOC108910774 n=1 Tax=Anoplophora glabripennis TaxID=217634 RepID=UPI0008756019|nr:uncharacterized protein LOC108910774 [Anoplophora glabripennis]